LVSELDCCFYFFDLSFINALSIIIGRATLSAAFGLAAKVAVGTQALMEATYETFESEDNSPAARNRSQSKNTTSMRGVQALAGVDSDDEV
jgi:hypothetical protein